MASTSPIVLMPSSLSIVQSSIWRLSLQISLLENVCAWILAEVPDMPALMNMLSQPGRSYPSNSTMLKLYHIVSVRTQLRYTQKSTQGIQSMHMVESIPWVANGH